MNQMTDMTLDLCSAQINDKGMTLLCDQFKQMKQLKNLSLNVSHNQFSNDCSYYFGQCLKQLEGLEQLDIVQQEHIKRLFFELGYFYDDNIGPVKRKQILPKTLQVYENSQGIEFNFSESVFTTMTQSQINLMMKILANQTKLKDITFPYFNDDNILILQWIVKNLYAMKYLNCIKLRQHDPKKIKYNAHKLPRLVNLITN